MIYYITLKYYHLVARHTTIMSTTILEFLYLNVDCLCPTNRVNLIKKLCIDVCVFSNKYRYDYCVVLKDGRSCIHKT